MFELRAAAVALTAAGAERWMRVTAVMRCEAPTLPCTAVVRSGAQTHKHTEQPPALIQNSGSPPQQIENDSRRRRPAQRTYGMHAASGPACGASQHSTAKHRVSGKYSSCTTHQANRSVPG